MTPVMYPLVPAKVYGQRGGACSVSTLRRDMAVSAMRDVPFHGKLTKQGILTVLHNKHGRDARVTIEGRDRADSSVFSIVIDGNNGESRSATSCQWPRKSKYTTTGFGLWIPSSTGFAPSAYRRVSRRAPREDTPPQRKNLLRVFSTDEHAAVRRQFLAAWKTGFLGVKFSCNSIGHSPTRESCW